MRRVVRRMVVDRPVATVFAACVDLLRTPDPSRGVVARSVSPDPPVESAVVTTTVRDRRGERSLTATVVSLLPGVEVSTVTDGAPAVRTTVRCSPHGDEATVVTVESEAEGTLSAFGRAGVLLDALLFASGQRRAARSTLRRIAELSNLSGSVRGG